VKGVISYAVEYEKVSEQIADGGLASHTTGGGRSLREDGDGTAKFRLVVTYTGRPLENELND